MAKGEPKKKATKKNSGGRWKLVSSVPVLPRRDREAHKGSFGRVLIIAGSKGMIGAPALVANAALRSGAGLVTVACPESIQRAVAMLCPCATTVPLPEEHRGLINPAKMAARLGEAGLIGKTGRPNVIAAGPGIGQDSASHAKAIVSTLLNLRKQLDIPMVLDADALNAIALVATELNETPQLPCCVITPHPGEMAKLSKSTIVDVQAERREFAAAASDGFSSAQNEAGRTIVVLKGAGTLVTDGTMMYENNTGNPGMATGGSGDVLTGVIAGLLGQRLSLMDASILGVHVHGLAGDLAAERTGEISLIATDLIDELPNAFRKCR